MRYGDEPGIVNGCVLGCVNADVKMHEYIWRVGMNYRKREADTLASELE
ncbi:MAG: hypothetical protein AB7E84_15165 [Xanthobacteraceae bacterium]